MSEKKLSLGTLLSFGFGGVANGAILNGLSFFVLVYYSYVVGLSPALAGTALAIALIFDAISDPLVGFYSDNLKSGNGRRLPLMFFSILPTAFLFWLIWNPLWLLNFINGPEVAASQTQLFWFLTVTVIALRISVTFYDIPHNAMAPSLTADYHDRTELAASKVSFAWISGQFLVIAMYLIWLVPTEKYRIGILNAEGYQSAGLFSAIMIGVAIFLTTYLLRNAGKNMKSTVHERSLSPSAFLSQLWANFSSPSLGILLFAGIFSLVGSGISAALWAIVMQYFWGLNSDATAYILIANLVGAIIGAFTIKSFIAKGEKKYRTIVVSIFSTLVAVGPIGLRVLGLMPENGSDMLFYILLLHGVVQVWLIVWGTSLAASLAFDIVDERISKRGAQNEGIVTAVNTFVEKVGTAGGIALAGFVAQFAGYTTSQATANADPQKFGMIFVVVLGALYLLSTLLFCLYPMRREQFDQHSQVSNRLKQEADAREGVY